VDAQNPGQAPATDDQELANVLAGIGGDAGHTNDNGGGLQFEETPAPQSAATDDAHNDQPADDSAAAQTPVVPEITLPSPSLDGDAATTSMSPELESLKKEALSELRPLVDKLALPADEKFDTLLLIIRSTDDQSLLNEAHVAAKAIEDETKRASALLDVIKEIDYFANQGK
jgi:hypothetical protein